MARSPGGARVVATRAGRRRAHHADPERGHRGVPHAIEPERALRAPGQRGRAPDPGRAAHRAPSAPTSCGLCRAARRRRPGGFRLVSSRKGSLARYQAVPMALALPPDVTVVARQRAASTTRRRGSGAARASMGVARAEAARPLYLSGDLTDDADRLSVACAAIDRCLVVAGGAHAWFFDGARFHETRVGEGPAGRALAVAAGRCRHDLQRDHRSAVSKHAHRAPGARRRGPAARRRLARRREGRAGRGGRRQPAGGLVRDVRAQRQAMVGRRHRSRRTGRSRGGARWRSRRARRARAR